MKCPSLCKDVDGLFSKTLLNRVLRENLGDLYQFLHVSRLSHLTDKCNGQTLRDLSALNRLGLWGFSNFLNGLQQVPMVQTVQKNMEIPQPQCIDTMVDDPHVQVPRVQVVKKTAEIPRLQTVEKIAETPQTQTIQGTQVPQSLAITPVRQVRQTGHVEELVEVSKVFPQDTVQQRFGKQTIDVPADSASPIFDTAPILENSPAHVAEYMKPALTVMCAHAAHVVKNATVRLPQGIVHGHPAPLTGAAPE